MPTITLDAFDDGIWLLGGRDQIPKAALRQSSGTNPVCANSLRQRFGNVQLSTIPSISLYNFYGHVISLDNAGNLYRDFSAIKTGLTNGNRASFVKSPPHFGSVAYLFVAGTGSQVKVDQAGNVTQWGITAPPNGFTAVAGANPINILINALDNASTLTAVNSAVLSTDSTNFITSTASVKVDIDVKLDGGFKKTGLTLNLMPPGSSDDDFIQFYVAVNDPTLFKGVVVTFELNNDGFHHDFYQYNAPFSSFIAAPVPANPNQSGNMDGVAGLQFGQPFTNPPPIAPSPIGQEFSTQLKNYLVNKLGTTKGASYFTPSSGSQQLARVNNAVTTSAGTGWWLVQIPRGAFTRIGGNQSLTWANVTGFKIVARNSSASAKISFNFNDLRFIGGTGMIGTYQYLVTYKNSTTGSYSQPNGASDTIADTSGTPPMPVTVTNVNRTEVNLGSFPTPSDPQVDTLIIWRTMGNGGIFYKLAELPLSMGAFPTTFIDAFSDYIGLGPNPANTANPMANWVTATQYAQGALILPTVGNAQKNVFIANSISGSGTSGGVEPTWPQSPAADPQQIGQEVIDNPGGNQIVWQNLGPVLSLGIEPLLEVNILPPPNATQAIFFKGTMFMCADSTAGNKGRIYYSSPGYEEGIAGYTDITNDDDPTTGFAIFNNNLYVFTQKALWLVIDISTNALLPAYAVVQQMGAPGCTAPYSIVATPNALIYQGADGLYAFDGFYAEAVAPHILPLFRGEPVEIYNPFGTITAATYGRDEYWFSDGATGTWAMNVMPSSRAGKKEAAIVVRQHSLQSSTALFFYQNPANITSSIVYAGWNGMTASLEVPFTFVDPGSANIGINWRTRSLYSGSKYTYKVQRAFFDINPGGGTFNAFVSLDGVDYFLGTITGASRAKFDFNFNKSGSVVGLYLTSVSSALSALPELFYGGIECNLSGQDDVDK